MKGLDTILVWIVLTPCITSGILGILVITLFNSLDRGQPVLAPRPPQLQHPGHGPRPPQAAHQRDRDQRGGGGLHVQGEVMFIQSYIFLNLEKNSNAVARWNAIYFLNLLFSVSFIFYIILICQPKSKFDTITL